jgi:hypothetical protein
VHLDGGDKMINEHIRGSIESMLDDMIREPTIIPDIRWVEESIPVSSIGEVALGYAIGSLEATAIAMARLLGAKKGESKEYIKTINAIIRRRLPELAEKINRELGV